MYIVDFNGNGQIDPIDIGIAIAIEEPEEDNDDE